MAVADADIEARDPLRRSWRGSIDATRVRRAETLQAVMIDQDRQVVETVMGDKDCRFERRPFLPFAIGRQAEHASVDALQLRRESHTGRQRQTMAEAARGESNTGDAVRRRMARKDRIILMEPIEIAVGQPAEAP